MGLNEADTCRKFVVPALQRAGWDADPHSIAEQRTFTDGRVIPVGNGAKWRKGKRVDYLLRYGPDFPLAVVEAKAVYRVPGDGLQQARDYAISLGLRFAYATNGVGIIEADLETGVEREIAAFPTPKELFNRLKLRHEVAERLLTPTFRTPGRTLRYYQDIAVNRAVQAVLEGKERALLTLATGTGKTTVAFQICWKLWQSKWNRKGEHRPPRILYLADRNILVDQPLKREFSAFGDAALKIENGQANKSRQMYFAIYQQLADRDGQPGLFRQFAPDFFDLIVVDECHRGSARADSDWRSMLDYFTGATKIGMTATPLREDNRDTYLYFGNPLYTYTLRQGMRTAWADPQKRADVIDALAERGVDFDTLAAAAGQPEADPFDLLCHVAFNAPLRTRRERAERLRKDRKDFFEQFGPEARSVLEALLYKYAEFGTAQFVLPDVLQVPPLSEKGNVTELALRFGGPTRLRQAVAELQTLLYAA